MTAENVPGVNTDIAAPSPPSKRRSKWGRWIGGSILFVGAAIWMLPWIVSKTELRNEVVRRFLFDWSGPIRCESARLGWIEPVEFQNIEMESTGGATKIHIPVFKADAPFWKYVFTRGDLGRIAVDQPEASVIVRRLADEAAKERPTRPTRPPITVEVSIQNAKTLLRRPESLAENDANVWTSIDEVSLRVLLSPNERMEQQARLDPCTLLRRVQVTPAMCDAGLLYIVPVLADLAWARGEASLDLEECRIALPQPKAARIKGRLTIHSLDTGGKSPLLIEIGRLVNSFIPGVVPRTIRVSNENVIEFETRDMGVVHKNFAFGLPELSDKMVIRTSGWICFDETLDLTAEIPIPLHLRKGKEETAQHLKVAIRGTLRKPKIDLKKTGGSGLETVGKILDQVAPAKGASTTPSEAMKQIGAALKENAKQWPGGESPAEKILTKGLPKVGRFAKKVIEGRPVPAPPADAKDHLPKSASSPPEPSAKKKPALKKFLQKVLGPRDQPTSSTPSTGKL